MITVIDLLSPEELAQIRLSLAGIQESKWKEGSDTAGPLIKHRKSNKQLLKLPQKVSDIIDHALRSNEMFNAITMPVMVSGMMVSRYQNGDGYGNHMDSAIAQKNMRRDLSISICLSQPEEFEGGELVFSLGSLRTGIKIGPGQAAVFSSTLEHKVNPVKGERLVVIAFVQSLIADPIEREIIFRLGNAISILGEMPAGELREELVSCISYAQENCGRKWISKA
jgi:PKHD-type hydroxylase